MRFVLGLVAGVVLIPVLVLAYLASGFGPTAATDKPLPGETFIARAALRQRIRKEAPNRDLSAMTTSDLLAGVDIYKKHCAVCHGVSGQDPAPIGNGMFPPAPQFFRPPPMRGPGPDGQGPAGAAPPPPSGRDGRGRGPGGGPDFWRIKNGIRLTGMPSFGGTLSDDQIWQVTAFLASRRNMPPEIKAALDASAATSSASPSAAAH
jgi:mono/diheme cytochrome c family protein